MSKHYWHWPDPTTFPTERTPVLSEEEVAERVLAGEDASEYVELEYDEGGEA